jgi:threonine/homoserine/homoserine lactone efflux protein
MVDVLTLLAFVPAALALNLTPGADMMFCLGQGVRSGVSSAVAASAGISVGSMVHVLLAGVGLGAAVAALPWLFDVIRWIGVAYLLWLALGAIRGGMGKRTVVSAPAKNAFRAGFIVNLTNPKVILFVLAFVPQFVDPNHGSVLGQFLIFGSVLAIGGFFINAGVGVFAGRLRQYLTGSSGFERVLAWISGGIFAALAMRLAILERG